ncbi:MAG TPA: GatB/YqeY domain-containing protein, partial [Candidatus Absconditabacterales bacterium]|nr:GatB/YqeY domain-containing protein [Candidatus Absconditabacterales bacterium]
IKQREESQTIYEKAGREEQALAEASEAAVLKNYLPKPMTEDEIRNAVRSISSDLLGVVSNTQALKGKTIGEFNKQFNGRADVSIVKRIVEEIVGN